MEPRSLEVVFSAENVTCKNSLALHMYTIIKFPSLNHIYEHILVACDSVVRALGNKFQHKFDARSNLCPIHPMHWVTVNAATLLSAKASISLREGIRD